MFSPEIMSVFNEAVLVSIKGMLGLFVFMGVFFGISQGMLALFPGKKPEREPGDKP